VAPVLVPAPAVAAAPAAPVVVPAQPAAPAPVQAPAVVASATPTADAPSPSPTPAELTAMEIAASIRRAQELLATGDVKAARALLQHAAELHDARAALALAKTYDPAVSRQSSLADRTGPDAVQARNWYQKAREWGSPEAQRLLDALASYQR
jgi:TPR repeat protein